MLSAAKVRNKSRTTKTIRDLFFLSAFYEGKSRKNCKFAAEMNNPLKKTGKPMKRTTALWALLLFCGMAFSQTKTVSVLGDSYSTYEGFLTPSTNAIWYHVKNASSKTDVTSVTQTWWHQVISKMGWRLCVNNSYSGSTICHTGYDGNDYSDRSFLTRMDNLGCPDIIFIFGATNDSWAHVSLGEYKYDGILPSDLWQFRPGMARLLEWMQQRYLGTELIFILNDGLTEGITESVKTICEHYGVKCIALKGIHKLSGHPSVRGMQQIAEQVMAAYAETTK